MPGIERVRAAKGPYLRKPGTLGAHFWQCYVLSRRLTGPVLLRDGPQIVGGECCGTPTHRLRNEQSRLPAWHGESLKFGPTLPEESRDVERLCESGDFAENILKVEGTLFGPVRTKLWTSGLFRFYDFKDFLTPQQ